MNLIQKLFCEFLKLEKARRNPDPKDTNKTWPYITQASAWTQWVSDKICTCLLYHMRRQLPFPCVGSAGKDRKSVQDCLILCIDVCCVCAHKCNTPLNYWPILWELTTSHATTTKTPTSKRPPIHQKYHSNTIATPEKYLANCVANIV